MTLDSRELKAEDLELIEFARTIVNEQTDDLVHTVGAAVRATDGSMHGGINLFHFTGGPCAELVALATARTNGARMLTTIVAVGNDGRGVIPPCGRDRQVLLDYHPSIRVILPTEEGDRSVAVASLLPLSYGWDPSA